MAQGKFSNPRPYREEERQIEQAFRQVTGKAPAPKRPNPAFDETQPLTHPFQPEDGQSAAPQAPEAEFDEKLFEESFRQMTGEIPTAQTQDPAGQPVRTAAAPQPQPQGQPRRKSISDFFDYIPDDSDLLSEEAPSEPSEPSKLDMLLDFYNKNKKAVMLGLCGAALVLIVVVIAIFMAGASDPYDNRILNNVFLADIDVGGMTKNEAISAVKQATNKTYGSEDMVIDLSGTELRLSPKDTDAELDVKAAVNAAYEYGRTGTQSERDKVYTASKTEEHVIALLPYLDLDTDYIQDTLAAYAEDSGSTLTQTTYGLEGTQPELSADKFNENAPCQTLVITMGTPGIGFDVNDVYNQVLDAYSLHVFLVEVENVESTTEPDPVDLEAIYKEFYIEPVDATVNLQTFETVPGSYGYGFDLEAAQKLIDEADYGDEIRIPMEYIEPDILDSDSFFRDTLGEHQTRATSNSNRNTNLQLACDELNDTVLEPGETLSFSDVVGKLSSAKGYKSAPEDTGRDDTMGGGVGQVSSTLYYAALLSDLDIVSRSNHGFVPSFIDRGLDATTSLKLRNSTSFPIRIEAELSGGYVKIKILGTDERDYYVGLDSTISSTVQPQTEYEDFEYENAEGYKDGDVIEEGTTGYTVKSYKIKYDNRTGKELSRDYLTSSQYPATNRVVARVEKPEETTVPTEAATVPTETTQPTETSAPTETTQPETEPSTTTVATTPVTEAQTEPPSSSESDNGEDPAE